MRTKGLNEDLLQRTLHNLREVCGEKAKLPETCKLPLRFSRLSDRPFSTSRYAEVWSGQRNPKEGNDSVMDVCIKVIKLKGVHKVGEYSHHSQGGLFDSVPQGFYGDIALWVKLNHPNILGCFGITTDKPQIVMEWMPNGTAMDYVQLHKRADRVCLVSSRFPLAAREVKSQPSLTT